MAKNNTIAKMRIAMRIAQFYQCAICDKLAIGETRGIDLDCCFVSELTNFLDGLDTPSTYMPIGWASFYEDKGTIFRCPICN